jgi:hypothetical protein
MKIFLHKKEFYENGLREFQAEVSQGNYFYLKGRDRLTLVKHDFSKKEQTGGRAVFFVGAVEGMEFRQPTGLN